MEFTVVTPQFLFRLRPRPALIAATVFGLAGCASLPADRGFSEVAGLTAERGLTLPAGDPEALSQQLLAKPLTPADAVTLAFLHNPSVRDVTARLGFAAADVYDAARLSNPVIGLTRLTSNDPAATIAQVTGTVALSFTDLLLLPTRKRFAEAQFEAAKLEVARAAQGLAADVETAWFTLAAAQQALALRQRVAQASQASADLAQRFYAAGNLNVRERALERGAAAQADLDVLAADAEVQAARSQLNRLMGLPAQRAEWKLAGALPAPLANEDALDELVALAMTARLDVAAARRSADAIADAYGLTRRTQLLGPVEVGYEVGRQFDNSREKGPSVSFELPLFNWGGGRVARAQAELDSAEARLAGLELDTSNDIAQAHAALLNAKARAERLRTGLIPERETVVEQMRLEVNYMLIGVFELLVAKQQEYDAYAAYLDAVRDYWQARVRLTQAVGQRLPSSTQKPAAALDALELTTPKGGAGHGAHGAPTGHGSHGAKSHDMPMTEEEGHAGHEMPKPSKPGDPHAGHVMPKPAPAETQSPPTPQDAHEHH
jgi:outer membrane protein, heavy metal efflux system